MDGLRLAHPPDLRRGGEPARRDRAAPARRSPRGRCTSSSSTTPRPTAPARSPSRSAPRSCTARARLGLGSAYVAGFAHALAHGAGSSCEMDADLSHDPADLPRLIALARDGADLVLGSRYVPGGGVEDWHLARRAISRAGCLLRARRPAACRCATSPAASSASAPARCARSTATGALAGLRVPGRADPSRAAPRPAGRRDPDRVPRARRRRSKMTPRIALEAAWLVPALRSVLGAGTLPINRHEHRAHGPRPGLGRHPRRAASLARPPRARCGPGRSAASRSRRCCSTLTWVVAQRSTPDLARSTSPASTRPPSSATSASSSTATGSCSRSRASRASPASWPARRSRRWPRATPASGAGSTTRPARWRSASSSARRSSRSPRRRTRSAAPPRPLARSSTSPRRCCSIALSLHARAGALRALPPARRVDASRAAARRWNELLAATFVTVAIAIPIVIAAAAVETWVTPGLLRWLAG